MCAKGFSLVEVLVAVTIITASVLGIMGIYSIYIKNSYLNTPSIQAAYLADEGVEAVKSLRDFGWTSNINNLVIGDTYYLYFNTALSRWQATTTNTLIDGVFDRSFVLSSARRNSSDDLVAAGGSIDANTRLVTVTVSWVGSNVTSTKTLNSYITNLFNN